MNCEHYHGELHPDDLMRRARVEANRLASSYGEPYAIVEQWIPLEVTRATNGMGATRMIDMREERVLRVQPADYALHGQWRLVEIVGMHDGMRPGAR